MGKVYYTSACYHLEPKFRTHFDINVSAAPCLSGYELQRSTDGPPGLLARPVPPVAQQDPPHQPGVHPESVHQPGHSPAHPPLLPLVSFRGKQIALVSTIVS